MARNNKSGLLGPANDLSPASSSQPFPLRVVIACRDGIAASALQCFIDRIPGVVIIDRLTDLTCARSHRRGSQTGALTAGTGWPAGRVLEAPADDAWLPAAPSARHPDASLVTLLSTRELQIFAMLVTGPSNRQLARSLGITERTVKAHIGAIMTKLGLESRLQVGLAALAYHAAQAGERTGPAQQGRRTDR